MQKMMIIGNVTKQPEDFNGVVKFSVAVNERYKKQSGEQVDETEFFNCVVFGKRGETVMNYVTKGMKIYVEGKMKTNEHNGKYYTSLIVNNFEFLGDGKKKDNFVGVTSGEPAFDDDEVIPF
jgi:single-strand DNA-binding protein